MHVTCVCKHTDFPEVVLNIQPSTGLQDREQEDTALPQHCKGFYRPVALAETVGAHYYTQLCVPPCMDTLRRLRRLTYIHTGDICM